MAKTESVSGIVKAIIIGLLLTVAIVGIAYGSYNAWKIYKVENVEPPSTGNAE